MTQTTRRLTFFLFLSAALLALGAACGEPQQRQQPDGGWTFDGGDEPGDTGGQADTGGGDTGGQTDAGERAPQSTAFEIRNNSGGPIYVQKVDHCVVNPPGWVESLTLAGESVQPIDQCGNCNCERLERGESCQPCPGACAIPTVETVPDGGKASWKWSGTVWAGDEVDGRSCERPVVPEQGATMSVELCFARAAPEGMEPGRRLEDPTCETVEFEYGETDPIRHSIPRQHTATKTRFFIENTTNQPIRVRKDNNCTFTPPGWMSVTKQGNPVKLNGDCTDCFCKDVRQTGMCGPVCGRACAPKTILEVKPGREVEWEWAGHMYERQTIDGNSCVEETVPVRGTEFDWELCWSPTPGQTGHNVDLKDLKCESGSFEYGVDTSVGKVVK